MRVKMKARARIHLMIREIVLVLLFPLLCCLYIYDPNDVLCKPSISNIVVSLCVMSSNFNQFQKLHQVIPVASSTSILMVTVRICSHSLWNFDQTEAVEYVDIWPDLGLHPARFVDVEIRPDVSLDIRPDLWLHPAGFVDVEIRPDVSLDIWPDMCPTSGRMCSPSRFPFSVWSPCRFRGMFIYLNPCNLLTSSNLFFSLSS